MANHLLISFNFQDDFNTVSVNKLKLSDNRPAKEHLSELSRDLDSSVTVCDVTCRKWREKNGEHVGSLVHGVGKCLMLKH